EGAAERKDAASFHAEPTRPKFFNFVAMIPKQRILGKARQFRGLLHAGVAIQPAPLGRADGVFVEKVRSVRHPDRAPLLSAGNRTSQRKLEVRLRTGLVANRP